MGWSRRRFLRDGAILLGGGLTLGSAPRWAQAARTRMDEDALRAMLATVREEHGLPGLVGGALYRGELVGQAAVGERKIGSGAALTVDDQLHLGSCTKAMTATLAAMLVKEGKLAWDTPLAKLLPDIAVHEKLREVTLPLLLSHRSGMAANTGPKGALFAAQTDVSVAEQRRQVVEEYVGHEPEHPSGSEFLYSNLGYITAGHVLEVATGKPWETLMRERLFEPLGMKSAGFGPPGTPGKVEQPWGHTKGALFGWNAVQVDNPAYLGPAGTVHASLADWAKFVALHLGHGNLLDAKQLAYLHTPVGDDYALGWGVAERDWGKGTVWQHSGSNTTWFCVVWAAPKLDAAFFAIANAGNTGGPVDEAVGGVIREFLKGQETRG